ncbi:MAG: extracellular solute-binding protein [Bacilli bacterium]|jgi:ABC-type glycerol-3-phosphate transport system substrate-binding protein
MRKLLVSLLIFGILLFSGCTDDDDRIKVTIGMWPEEVLTKDVEMFKKWEKNFERDYPQYDIIPDHYTYSPETVNAKATSNQLPVVFQTYFTEPKKLIANGFIRDITKELMELGWYDKMDPMMRETLSEDGKIYGVPRDGYGLGLFLNLEMLYYVGEIDKNEDGTYRLHDEEGNPLYPTTFADIRRISELIVENMEYKYGIVILSANKNGGWQFSNMAWNFGCANLQVYRDGKWEANLNDPGAVRALEWIQRMRNDDLIPPDASLSYNDWYSKIGSGQVAMAFCGSDALALPVSTFNFPLDQFAFVPMPTGDGVSRYSLYGGTPYVFSANATDEQVKGALLFLKYMGRSPEIDDISLEAMELGFQTAQAKAMPILPTIKAWADPDYLEVANELEEKYINVNMDYFRDFFDTIEEMKKPEEPHYCQDMYGLLDNAIQSILSNPVADPLSELTIANNQFQKNFLSKINK